LSDDDAEDDDLSGELGDDVVVSSHDKVDEDINSGGKDRGRDVREVDAEGNQDGREVDEQENLDRREGDVDQTEKDEREVDEQENLDKREGDADQTENDEQQLSDEGALQDNEEEGRTLSDPHESDENNAKEVTSGETADANEDKEDVEKDVNLVTTERSGSHASIQPESRVTEQSESPVVLSARLAQEPDSKFIVLFCAIWWC